MLAEEAPQWLCFVVGNRTGNILAVVPVAWGLVTLLAPASTVLSWLRIICRRSMRVSIVISLDYLQCLSSGLMVKVKASSEWMRSASLRLAREPYALTASIQSTQLLVEETLWLASEFICLRMSKEKRNTEHHFASTSCNCISC